MTKIKHLKVKNPLASSKLWDVFSSIEEKICQEAHLLAFSADAMKVLLLLNRLICFEDCVTFSDRVLTKVTKVLIILSIVKRNLRLVVYLH